MSSAFDAAMIQDAAAILSADSGEFAEEATYRPRTGTDRTIDVIITRNPPATPEELKQGVAPSLIIEVKNTTTRGIALSELDVGGDAILLKTRLGGADAAQPILLPEPASQDAAALVFKIGKRA